MSAAREKDQADFDLEQFVDLFDTAMTSDNPAVKKAFKNLLLLAALVSSDDKDEAVKGPLRRLIDDQRIILRRIERLESEKHYPNPMMPTPYNPGTPWNIPTPGTIPTWPNTGLPGGVWYGPGNTTTSTSYGASSTAYDDQYMAEHITTKLSAESLKITQEDFDKLFSKLESKNV